MTAIDLAKIIGESEFTFRSAIRRIAEEGNEELTVAVHSAFDITPSLAPPEAKREYLESVKAFLQHCKDARLKIMHLRDMLPQSVVPEQLRPNFAREQEPSLLERYGVKADYEVATFFNFGVPIDLMMQFFEQKGLYGIFRPAFYPAGQIPIVNGIGCFSESSQCLTDGISLMERLAGKQVRVIKECVLPATGRPYRLSDSRDKYCLPTDKISLYSFTGTELVKV